MSFLPSLWPGQGNSGHQAQERENVTAAQCVLFHTCSVIGYLQIYSIDHDRMQAMAICLYCFQLLTMLLHRDKGRSASLRKDLMSAFGLLAVA